MEKLEKIIESTLVNNLETEDMSDNTSVIEFESIQTCTKYIASEVKDIAIAFAFKARAANEVWSDDYRKPIEQLWNDFITTYYK